jgi:hypothetical protein
MDISKKAIDRACGRSDLAFHAVAGVENDSHADRLVVGPVEMGNLLTGTVLFQPEVGGFQALYIPTHFVGDGSDYVYEADVDPELAGNCQSKQEEPTQEE